MVILHAFAIARGYGGEAVLQLIDTISYLGRRRIRVGMSIDANMDFYSIRHIRRENLIRKESSWIDSVQTCSNKYMPL